MTINARRGELIMHKPFLYLIAFGALLFATVIATAPLAQAATTRTWTGADPANANWSDADNWDTGAPVEGESLVFPQSAARKANVNDYPEGTAFHDITFTGGGYQVSGAAIELTGVLRNASGGDTNIFGVGVDGAGSVEVVSGRLALTAANSYDGATSVAGGTLLVSGHGTLGSTAAGTTIASGARLQLSNNANIGDEHVRVAGMGIGGTGALQSLSGTNRAGRVELDGAVTVGAGSSTLIIGRLDQAAPGAALKLAGGGKLEVQGAGTFAGAVTAEHGNLTWNAANAPAVTVEKDGWLRGIGTVGSVSSAGSLLWPGSGNAPGVLTANGMVTLGGGAFRVDLDGPAVGTGHGQLVTNGFAITGSSKLEIDLGYQPAPGQSFTIVNSASPVTGTFHGLAEGATFAVGAYAFTITYKGGSDGNDIVLTALRALEADLAASISAEPVAALPGQNIRYTLTMRNDGPDPAVTPRFSIGIPAGTSFVSVRAPGWTCTTPPHSPASILCTGSTLASGSSATIAVTVRVNANAAGNVSATVATFSATNDSLSADNSATLVLPVTGGGTALPFRRFLPGVSLDASGGGVDVAHTIAAP